MFNNNKILDISEKSVNCISKLWTHVKKFVADYWTGVIIGIISNTITISIAMGIYESNEKNPNCIHLYYDHIICFFLNIISTIIFYIICKRHRLKIKRKNSFLQNSLHETSKKLINQRRETFARIAHDLRTPMQIINGCIEIIKGELPGNKDQAMADIKKFSELSEKIIDNFLKLEKSQSLGENDNIQILKPLVLKSFFENIISGFKTKISNDNKNIEFILNYNLNNDATFLIDEVYFYEIFQNFISNSIKFTNQGYITITIKDITDQQINNLIVNIDHNKNYSILHFEIEDTGIGMTQIQISELFKEYNRVHYSSHGNIPGTGLGLCIAQQYVRLINKNSNITNQLIDIDNPIQVESICDDGTTFSFNLILLETDKPIISNICNTSQINKEPNLSKFNLKILIVEDSSIVSQLNGKYLNKLGIVQIDYANNGLTALNMIKKPGVKYNFIFMDGNMPIMDGYVATHQIKNVLKLSTPIIFCTGDGLDHEIQKAKDAGAIDHIIKPFTAKKMGLILLKYLT